jgi:hypothetical protein
MKGSPPWIYIYIYIYIYSIYENLNLKNWVLECRLSLSVCMYICMYVCLSLSPVRLDGFYSYSVLKNLSIIDRYPVAMNIVAPKIWALQIGPEVHNVDFLENGSNSFIKFQ